MPPWLIDDHRGIDRERKKADDMASSRPPKFLALDWETSGLRDHLNSQTTYLQGPQGLEIGAAVLHPETYEPVDRFTAKMKFLGKHKNVEYGEFPDLTWSEEAERIHGMTIMSLIREKHPKMVAQEFAAFLRRHYGPGDRITIVGHNPELDRYHTLQLLYYGGLLSEFKIDHRMIDTHTIGFMLYGCNGSEELFFKVTGQKRTYHTALWDAEAAGAVFRHGMQKMNEGTKNYLSA